jgi:hypothetical protein
MQSSMQSSNTLDADSHDLGVNSSVSNADSHDLGVNSPVSNADSPDSDSDDASQTWGDDTYCCSSPPRPICGPERHPHTLFSVDPWSSHCIEYGGKILVIARDAEECCDILHQRYGGSRHEIEVRVSYAYTLWLASSNMTSGIWQTILH